MSPYLSGQLDIGRCPHCGVANPTLENTFAFDTRNYKGNNHRFWRVYVCKTCGGLVTATSNQQSGSVIEMFPAMRTVDESIPAAAKSYLGQAMESIHAPAGAIMLAASAVDAMLKKKDYKKGSLYDRINKAAEDNLITEDMAKWAHEVRLDANVQRHSDEKEELPTEKDAQKSIDFALALAEFLFVLPSRVQHGLEEAKGDNTPN